MTHSKLDIVPRYREIKGQIFNRDTFDFSHFAGELGGRLDKVRLDID
jgi:hypothetical protein